VTPPRLPAAATHEFEIESLASPNQVWAALTTPESTQKFMFGIRLESTWRPGSPVVGRLNMGSVLQGEVLYAECPSRLSYVIADGPKQPEAYVTWEARACGDRSIVRLSVVESAPLAARRSRPRGGPS
jgi:uncharacterized protein YndB with AHSA1/START domain